MNKPRFTIKENDTIITCIKNNPTNLQYAFEVAAKLNGRSVKATENHWYRCLKEETTSSIVAAGSLKGYKKNTKNTLRINGIMPEVELEPYLVVVQELLKLSKKERKIIIALLTLKA